MHNIILCTNDTIVVQPVITSTSVGDAGTPRFTIITEQFSFRYGGLGAYKVYGSGTW